MSDLAADLRVIIEAERVRFEVPGCAVLAVADGQTVLCEGFGSRDVERDLPVTPRTLFPIASSTKTFTAALCAVLVDEGRLAWDQPVRKYLTDFAMADPVATEQLTVFDMLCHRSGLPRHDLLWYAADGHAERKDLVRALRHLQPNRGFRETWQYNNLMYTTAGELAGHLLDTTYESALRQRVLDPLGMKRTNFSVDETQADADAATPYVAEDPTQPLHPVPFARLDLVGPAGALNSCLADLEPWLLTLLGRGVSGRPLLSEGVLAVLRSPATPLPAGSQLTLGTPVGYGLGLVVEDYRGCRVTHHGGNIDGFSSQVSFMFAESCGVVVLCNRDGTGLRDALPALVYDRVLGLPPRAHGESMLARERAIHTGRAQSRERTTMLSSGMPAVRHHADYAGTYSHPGYGEILVTETTNGLQVSYRALNGPLVHQHLDVFTLMVELGGVSTPLPVQFVHGFDGEVSAAVVALEQEVDPVRFERVPDDTHLTTSLLDSLTGTYRLGPLTTVVERRGGTGLVATVVEGSARELRLLHDLVFSMDGKRIEFTDDGRLLTPAGEFTRG